MSCERSACGRTATSCDSACPSRDRPAADASSAGGWRRRVTLGKRDQVRLRTTAFTLLERARIRTVILCEPKPLWAAEAREPPPSPRRGLCRRPAPASAASGLSLPAIASFWRAEGDSSVCARLVVGGFEQAPEETCRWIGALPPRWVRVGIPSLNVDLDGVLAAAANESYPQRHAAEVAYGYNPTVAPAAPAAPEPQVR